jgi:RNA polymerase sigma-70 factor (ECF subfamily)
MLLSRAGIPDREDTPAPSLAAEQGEPEVAFACNSGINGPTVDKYCGIAEQDREWITLPVERGIENFSNTMTTPDVESGASTWDAKLVTFTQVAEQRRAQLLWLAQRITHDRDEAEDVVQEALFRAFKNLPQFRGESQIGTWLGVIVKNTGREWLRNQKGRVYLSLEHARNPVEDPIAREFPDPRRDPEQSFVHKEMNDILLSEIDRLKSVCKSTIQMCAIEESSHREAADTLGVSVAAIKSRVFHGKRLLKRAVCLRTGVRVELLRSMEPAL